jgi:hypothetical protein
VIYQGKSSGCTIAALEAVFELRGAARCRPSENTICDEGCTMTAHYDQDNGVGTELTEDHRYAIEEAIKQIDFELGRSSEEYAQELNRQRRHLMAELACGRRLAEPDDEE